jgi:prolyl oligopeptidase
MKYPTFEKLPDVEDFHGEEIPDPYKWLEEPDSEKTKVKFFTYKS